MKTRKLKKVLLAGMIACAVVCMLLFVSCGKDDIVSSDVGFESHKTQTDLTEAENGTAEQEIIPKWTFVKKGSITCNKISNNSYSNAIVYKLGGKYGIVDNEGNTVLEPKYDSIDLTGDSLYCNAEIDGQRRKLLRISDGEVMFDGSMSVINGVAVKHTLEKLEMYDVDTGEEILSVEIPEGKFAQCSFTDTLIYTVIYAPLGSQRMNGELSIYDKNGNLIYYDTDVTRFELQEDNPNNIYWEKGKYPDEVSYIEIDGKVHSNTEFEQNGLYQVGFDLDSIFNKEYKLYRYYNVETKKYGIKSFSGREILPAEYEHCSIMNNGIIHVSNEDAYDGFYNVNGEKISDCIYSYYGEKFYDGLLSVAMGDYWGIMNEEGVLVYPTQIERDRFSKETHENPAYFLEGNRVLNYETGEIRAYESIDFENFPEGLFAYKKPSGACGLATYKGELVEFENGEISCTADKKVIIVKQYNEYTFYEIEKN